MVRTGLSAPSAAPAGRSRDAAAVNVVRKDRMFTSNAARSAISNGKEGDIGPWRAPCLVPLSSARMTWVRFYGFFSARFRPGHPKRVGQTIGSLSAERKPLNSSESRLHEKKGGRVPPPLTGVSRM